MTGRRWLDGLWFPSAVYAVIFFALNPHLATAFSSHFFFGGNDGYQNIWNLWWVDRAIRELGTQPWQTGMLHHPYGTSLIGHTLNPFNGLLAIPLLRFLTMVQTYNAIVVFSFIATGVTAFWLCRELTRSYGPSLVGGAIFTFSSFHFMHADAHLQLTALQWLPLFVLLWIRFCEAPRPRLGVLAAVVLWLVALCDLYYFAYAVITGALFYVWTAWKRRDPHFLLRPGARGALAAFLVPSLMSSGALVASLVYQHAADPLLGTHSPRALSMDLLSPFAYGYYWRFRDAVPFLWRPLSDNFTEASVHVGFAVIGLAICAWRVRARHPIAHLGFWCVLAAFFAVMSLGPNLHIAGYELQVGPGVRLFGHDDVNLLVMPYAVVWLLFPPWRLAGVPLRMMVMVQLVAAIMAAGGLRALLASSWRWRHCAAAAALVVVTVEYLPATARLTDPAMPAYVSFLRNQPDGAVIDLASHSPWSLYYQTVHEKPIAFGYISRTPASVDRQDRALAALIVAGNWEQAARNYKFTYVVRTPRSADIMVPGLNDTPLAEIDPARRIYRDDRVEIYRF